MTPRRASLLLLVLLPVLIAGAPARAQSAAPVTLVTIGTGPLDGTYYPVGRAICRLLDRALRAEGVRCSAESTPGSVYNVNMLRRGELDFALVQADVQFAALHGQGEWRDQPFQALRAVASLYKEVFTLVAAPESGLAGLEDLRSKHVNIGRAGSGTRATWNALATILDWQGPAQVRGRDRHEDVATALCEHKIDASVAVGFQPSPAVRAQLSACATRLIEVSGPAVEALLVSSPFYRRASIPAAVYGLATDVSTFGVASDLVTSLRTEPRVVAAIARAIAENAAGLATQSPALAQLDPGVLTEGLTLPLHPAAADRYRALGLMR
jgi:hypothetical protein